MNRSQRRAGASQPMSVATAFAQGLDHHKAGRLQEAERLYVKVIGSDPMHTDGLHLLGVLAHQTGRHAAAAALIRQAITLASGIGPYHSSMGLALQALGRLDDAVASFQSAITLSPDLLEAHSNLGIALMERGSPDEAVACFQKALSLSGGIAALHNNLGAVFKLQGRIGEATACFRDALALRPSYAEAWNNLGTALTEGGQPGEAVACFRTAVAIDPALPDAHFNLATVLLALGEMKEGWQEFEWRWATGQMANERRTFTQPQWRGGPGDGRTLLVHAEQGFGDTMQFCRYAPMASALGWKVVLEVQEHLVQLFRGMPGVGDVVARGTALPGFDFHCPMLSMPLAFGTTLADVPASIPYLRPEEARRSVWRDRLSFLPARGLRVGLAWAGSARLHSPARAAVDRRRSVPPDMLCRLLEIQGVAFFSLQRGGPALPKDAPVIDLMPEIQDFADTAALVANLDLVISVDTAVAHLAGAMGKPVWMIDRFDPCWRWLAGRDDSPWYPTMRIFRQQEPGDWWSVIGLVRTDLAKLATDY